MDTEQTAPASIATDEDTADLTRLGTLLWSYAEAEQELRRFLQERNADKLFAPLLERLGLKP